MTGTITFGGVGSGIDTESIVSGLVKASQGPLDAQKSQASSLTSANSSLTQIGSLLGKLQTALEAVDETRDVGSYTASSSSSAIIATATGNALPGAYQVSVDKLAAEQRTYSNGYAASTTALGLGGSLDFSVAGGANTSIALDGTDTLESIASKINASGARVSAAVFHDGNQYRLQVRGLDSGAANAITFSGTTLGLDVAANTRQAASDAQVTIDGFTVNRSTNQLVGVIPGVTLNLTATTPTGSPTTVKVDSDPQGLKDKLNSVVSAYNAVVDMVHTVSGFGTQKASVDALAGDSLLRSLTTRMSSAVSTQVGTGQYSTLTSLGIQFDTSGHIKLDATKLDTALKTDPASVAKVIAGPEAGTGAGTGVADLLDSVVKAFTTANTGLIASRQTSITSRIKNANDAADREQTRLDAYAASLRKQFTALDTLMSQSSQNSSYLTNFFK
jgi:flagellar hook-associated protein 2